MKISGGPVLALSNLVMVSHQLGACSECGQVWPLNPDPPGLCPPNIFPYLSPSKVYIKVLIFIRRRSTSNPVSVLRPYPRVLQNFWAIAQEIKNIGGLSSK